MSTTKPLTIHQNHYNQKILKEVESIQLSNQKEKTLFFFFFYQIQLTYISIKLPHEAGEIVVLEVFGEQILFKTPRIPNNEAGIVQPPRNNGVRGGIIHHVIRLREERRRRIRAPRRPLHVPLPHANPSTPPINPNASRNPPRRPETSIDPPRIGAAEASIGAGLTWSWRDREP